MKSWSLVHLILCVLCKSDVILEQYIPAQGIMLSHWHPFHSLCKQMDNQIWCSHICWSPCMCMYAKGLQLQIYKLISSWIHYTLGSQVGLPITRSKQIVNPSIEVTAKSELVTSNFTGLLHYKSREYDWLSGNTLWVSSVCRIHEYITNH